MRRALMWIDAGRTPSAVATRRLRTTRSTAGFIIRSSNPETLTRQLNVRMVRRLLRLAPWPIVAAGLLASCEHLVDPPLPAGAVRFTPPPVYSVWWEMTKSCSGINRSLESVDWYEAGGNGFSINGELVSAYWSAAGNQIILHSSVVRNGQIVRHEMLHALVQSKGHSREAFIAACGGVVSCTNQCREEAGPGPAPDPSDQRVPASAITVTSILEPVTPSLSVNDGYFALTVSATNARAFPVVVTLGTGQSFAPIGFSALVGGNPAASFEVPAAFNDATMFKAGETKRHVFDFFGITPDGRGMLPAGNYTLTGRYGGNAAPTHAFTIAP